MLLYKGRIIWHQSNVDFLHGRICMHAEAGPVKLDHQQLPSGYHPVECAVNMLLARIAFDVLRSPEVKQKLIAHIHRKVNELRFPSYIHGIEV